MKQLRSTDNIGKIIGRRRRRLGKRDVAGGEAGLNAVGHGGFLCALVILAAASGRRPSGPMVFGFPLIGLSFSARQASSASLLPRLVIYHRFEIRQEKT
jgi:hypothetical protein